MAGSAGIATRKKARQAAALLAVVLFLVVLFFHLPAPGPILRDGVARTRAFETLALCVTALVMTGTPPVLLGRLLFALCMAVFGIQHFMYARFVAALVPSWIPGPLFWA